MSSSLKNGEAKKIKTIKKTIIYFLIKEDNTKIVLQKFHKYIHTSIAQSHLVEVIEVACDL